MEQVYKKGTACVAQARPLSPIVGVKFRKVGIPKGLECWKLYFATKTCHYSFIIDVWGISGEVGKGCILPPLKSNTAIEQNYGSSLSELFINRNMCYWTD